MKRVLLISPHFPPVNAPDCQRIRMSLRFYRESGWDAVVLAVHPRHRADWHDESLKESLPTDVPVHYCEALPLQYTRLLGIQNLGLRCLLALHRKACALLREGHFDLVFFSTTQFMVMPLGLLWQRRFGVHYVIDLQDPWRSDYYERPGSPRPPGGWKYQFARLTAWMFEERTFRGAKGFISVSHYYFRNLGARYPWFGAKPTQVIPFGAPQADFDFLRRQPGRGQLAPAGKIHLVAAGALGPGFSHALRVLFSGLKRLRMQQPALADRLRLHFVGTSYAQPKMAVLSARPIAEAYGVDDLVEEMPYRIGYLDSLRLMQAADALLILGSDDLAYSPSKIYPCYLTQRPILGLAHHGSLLQYLLGQLHACQVVSLLSPGLETAPPHEVAWLLALAAEGRLPATAGQEAWFQSHLSARACTARQCTFFEYALSLPATPALGAPLP